MIRALASQHQGWPSGWPRNDVASIVYPLYWISGIRSSRVPVSCATSPPSLSPPTRPPAATVALLAPTPFNGGINPLLARESYSSAFHTSRQAAQNHKVTMLDRKPC